MAEYSPAVESKLAAIVEKARAAGDRDVPVMWPTYSDFRVFWHEHGNGEPWQPAWRRVEAAVAERIERNQTNRVMARSKNGRVGIVVIKRHYGQFNG